MKEIVKKGCLIGLEDVIVGDGFDISIFEIDVHSHYNYKYILNYNGNEIERGFCNPVSLLRLLSKIPIN